MIDLFYSRIVFPLLFWFRGVPYQDSLRKLSVLVNNNNLLSEYHTKCLGMDVSEYLDKKLIFTKECFLKLKNINEERFITRKTSGASGIPLVLNFSRQQIADQQAIRQLCYQKVGIRLGEREARFWGRDEKRINDRIIHFILNRKIFNDSNWNEEKLLKLVSYKPTYIYGYSSLLLAAAKAFAELNIVPPPVKAVICTAESIQDFQISILKSVFKAPVLVEYGCTEFDIIAIKFNEGYTIVNPNIIVEDFENQIIVTDVSNLVFTRYKIGDGAVFAKEKKYYSANDTIMHIRGRSIKRLVYLENEKTCHAGIFSSAVKIIHDNVLPVYQFRVRQKTIHCFAVEINTIFDFIPSEHQIAKIKAIFDNVLEYHATYDLSFGPLKELPGKHDYFINEMNRT